MMLLLFIEITGGKIKTTDNINPQEPGYLLYEVCQKSSRTECAV